MKQTSYTVNLGCDIGEVEHSKILHRLSVLMNTMEMELEQKGYLADINRKVIWDVMIASNENVHCTLFLTEVQSLYHLVENDGRYMSQANIRTVINTCALRLQGSTIFLGTKRIPFSELDQGTPAVNSILDIMVKRPT
jgi:hypothetical protein